MASDPEVVAEELAEYRQVETAEASTPSELYVKYDGGHSVAVFETVASHGWVLDSLSTTHRVAHLYFIPAEDSEMSVSFGKA